MSESIELTDADILANAPPWIAQVLHRFDSLAPIVAEHVFARVSEQVTLAEERHHAALNRQSALLARIQVDVNGLVEDARSQRQRFGQIEAKLDRMQDVVSELRERGDKRDAALAKFRDEIDARLDAGAQDFADLRISDDDLRKRFEMLSAEIARLTKDNHVLHERWHELAQQLTPLVARITNGT